MEEDTAKEMLALFLGGGSCGIACAFVARMRGRGPFLWFLVGIFLNFFGLITLLSLPDLKGEEQKYVLLAKENKRLHEMLKNLQRGMGISEKIQKDFDFFSGSCWYFIEGSKKAGPVGYCKFKRLWLEGRITPDTLIWNETMDDWKTIREVLEVAEKPNRKDGASCLGDS